MTIAELIEAKLDEYGIEISHQYEYDGATFIVVEDMILCYDNNTKKLEIAFEASTIPERVANNIMILLEIDELGKSFTIMDSFVYSNNMFLSGEQAHEMVKKHLGTKYARQEAFFNQLLQNPIGTA